MKIYFLRTATVSSVISQRMTEYSTPNSSGPRLIEFPYLNITPSYVSLFFIFRVLFLLFMFF
jgi:hypothetical protein